MQLIAVEGNIGSGKSTMLPKLAEEIGFKFVQEPVDDPRFLELLNQFTKNPNDTSKRLAFQQYITERRANLLNGVPDGNYLIERSLYSDLVFSQVNMLGMERPDGAYLSYYYDIKDRLKDYPQVDAVVYLKTSPLVCHKRMTERGREEEKGTPLAYLADISHFHDACLPQICREYGAGFLRFEWDYYGAEGGGIKGIADKLRRRHHV